MVKLELPYDIRLVSGTAYWLSGIAEQGETGDSSLSPLALACVF